MSWFASAGAGAGGIAIAYTYLCTYFLYIYLLKVEIISAKPNSMVESYAPRCDSFIHVNDANLIYVPYRVGQ